MQVQRVVESHEIKIKTDSECYKIWDNQGNFLGSLYINKAKMVWCKGRTRPENGKSIRWEDFIEYMNAIS